MGRSTVGIILILALGLLCAPLTAATQPPAKMPRIGWLASTSPPLSADRGLISYFRQGLRELGWVEGQNIVIESRWAEGRFERLADLATELVRLKVEVLYAQGGAAAVAAKQATDTIPIVTMTGDPVAQGLLASLARPGGNVTGVSLTNVVLSQKRLEILQEVLARPSRVAVLWCPDAVNRQQLRETQVAAHA